MRHYTQYRCPSPLCRTLHFCPVMSAAWLNMQSVPGSTTCREECTFSSLTRSKTHLRTCPRTWCLTATISSLVEAGTVNDLRELSERVHRVHGFFWCLRCALCVRLVGDVQSGERGLIQGADPGEELGQSRHASVSTLHPLPLVSQTEQSSVSVGDVDVVAVRQDLLSEGAVVSAVGVLEMMGHTW